MHDVEQLRRDLAEAVNGLSASARGVWDELEEMERRVASGEEIVPELPPQYKDLSPSEQDALRRTLRLSQELHEAQAAEDEGMATLMRQGAGVMKRAQELEPNLGDDTTLEEAIAVLQRHGIDPGLSPELEEMVVEVPTEEVDATTEMITVPAYYPSFTNLDLWKKWDGSQEAKSWVLLRGFRAEVISESVNMIRQMVETMQHVSGDEVDVLGLAGVLWGVDADEVAEIIEETSDPQ